MLFTGRSASHRLDLVGRTSFLESRFVLRVVTAGLTYRCSAYLPLRPVKLGGVCGIEPQPYLL